MGRLGGGLNLVAFALIAKIILPEIATASRLNNIVGSNSALQAICSVPKTTRSIAIGNEITTALESCVAALKARSYDRQLLSYLVDQQTICRYRQGAEVSTCHTRALEHAHDVLTCKESPIREREMAMYDQSELHIRLREHGEAEIPEQLRAELIELASAAEARSRHLQSHAASWEFRAYKSPVLQAHAGQTKLIVASSGLWAESSPLSHDEIVAILAHEAAHVALAHSKEFGCRALEWVGPGHGLSSAMRTFFEDYSVFTPRGADWTRHSVAAEYDADRVGIELLAEIGIDPTAMPRALEKLRPKTNGGISSGTHPEFDERITAAQIHSRVNSRGNSRDQNQFRLIDL